jgi:hypothetical protein
MKVLLLIIVALSLSGCAHSISPGVQVHVTVGEGKAGYQEVHYWPTNLPEVEFRTLEEEAEFLKEFEKLSIF